MFPASSDPVHSEVREGFVLDRESNVKKAGASIQNNNFPSRPIIWGNAEQIEIDVFVPGDDDTNILRLICFDLTQDFFDPGVV